MPADGASSVDAITPKKGTKPVSRRPKSMSGSVEEGVARGLTALAPCAQRTVCRESGSPPWPKRHAAASAAAASITGHALGRGRRRADLPASGRAASPLPATSRATKCGTSHITGRFAGARPTSTSPSTWISRLRRASRLAYQSTPRSSSAAAEPAAKCSRTSASRSCRRRVRAGTGLDVASTPRARRWRADRVQHRPAEPAPERPPAMPSGRKLQQPDQRQQRVCGQVLDQDGASSCRGFL